VPSSKSLVLVALAAAACGLADVFASPGPKQILLRYCGDTTLQKGVAVPTLVTATADGAPLSNPRLLFAVSDTSVLALLAGGDSVVGKKNGGRAAVTVQLESTILTDTLPTVAETLNVIGGPPSLPPTCP
jgi:hypothetical protein